MAKSGTKTNTGANLGFEAKLWQAADKLRSNMDAAEYKHVVLGLIFLKYISDSFAEQHQLLLGNPLANAEDKDEYTANNIFWVPAAARWNYLQSKAHTPEIGKLIDEAMDAIEKDNRRLKNILPKNYARPDLDKAKLGELIDLIGTIGLGDKENRSKDILGRVYEYFLSEFASAEGKQGGQFYTPRCVVQLLVAMLAPQPGKRIFDPCCGSGGMFVQSEKFVEAQGGHIGDIAIYGQESNPTTWRLAKMNLAIRGIEADLGAENADSFLKDLHKDKQFDFVIANPPFNMKDWGGEQLKKDPRWQYGIPPEGNANYAWIQHFIYHLAPTGRAGFVLANSSMSSNTSGDGEIRKNIIEKDLVDCIISLPGQLFYSMYSQVCLWFIDRNKRSERKNQILFIDARNYGMLKERTYRELSEIDIHEISSIYKSWKNSNENEIYSDVPGLCRSVHTEEIRIKRYNLVPGRYVGADSLSNPEIPSTDTIIDIKKNIPYIVEITNRYIELAKNWGNIYIESACNHVNEIVEDSNLSNVSSLSILDLNEHLQSVMDEFTNILFRSWFVDFDPVNAKIEGLKRNLSPELDLLFPDSLVDSPLGDIPSGWRVGTYSEIFKQVNIKIGSQDAPEYSATVRGLELREHLFNMSLAKVNSKNKRIQRNDIVFGLSRRTLNFGLMTAEIGSVSPIYEVFNINDGAYIPALIELYIRFHIRSHMDILKPGAREGQPIDRKYLLGKEVLIPDMRVQNAFWKIVQGRARC